ncbi:hypothetical protein AB0B66_43235 [Catellatospora sp. NPDC049111]|uniref:hypothetical protein n=1 Tax=Catellatospora sp. NPDC049111 TaxID=3155271 RepID=UPI0033E9B9DC
MSSEIDAAAYAADTASLSGRIATRVQYVLAGAYFLAVAVALGRAAQLAGRFYLPHQGDEATGTADIWPGVLAAVWLAITFVLSIAPILAGLTALYAIVLLASARLRADRRRWRSLAASTVLSALAFAASLTPQARTLLVWLLD